MSASAERIVRDFCDAWKRRNIDELMSFFAEDAVYHNVPVPAVKGASAIREAFLAFAKRMDRIELENRNVAAAGDVVFTERIDHFSWQGKTLALPVAGVFEVRDGKISAHRDYFDYATWLNATGIALG